MRRLCDAPPLSQLKGWRDRALLHTLASSGVRAFELVTLREGQVIARGGNFFAEVMGKYQTYPRQACLSHEARAAVAWHGGLSTGPRTPEGKRRIGEAAHQRARMRRHLEVGKV
jgi:site-specific recombinase XerC